MKPALCRFFAYCEPGFPKPAIRSGVSMPPPLALDYFLAGAAGLAPAAPGLAPAAPGAAAPAAGAAAPAAPAAGTTPSTGATSTTGAAAAAVCSSITLVGATMEQMGKSRPRITGFTPAGRVSALM